MNFENEQDSQSLLKTVLGSLREGILVVNQNLGIVLYNYPAAEIFNLPRVAPGPASLRLIDVTRNKVIHQGFQKVLEEQVSFHNQIQVSDEKIYDFRVTPLSSSAGQATTGAVGVFFEITQLVRLERVRREFFANLSHELRTPLTSNLVYVETLLNGALYDAEHNLPFLKIINKHATRMHNLVKDISDLSAIEANETSYMPVPIEVRGFVENLASLIQSDLITYELTFANNVPPGLYVFADFKSLEQILMNLIINGIKFNRPGGEVEVNARADGETHILISVRDTGIGIEPQHLPRIFERLYRVDKSRSQEAGGTGLGLAIVKHLVLAQQGEIMAESAPNEGSVFCVRLPRSSARNNP